MDIDTLNGLSHCQLFNGIPESDIIEMMHTIRYRVLKYRKGDIFTTAGTPCVHADIIINGEMVANLIGPSGRIIRMTTKKVGNMLAPAFLFAKDNHYPVTIEAITDTETFRIQDADMQQLLESNPQLMMNYIHLLSNIIANLTKKVGILSMNIREKVTLYLKEQKRLQQTDFITLPLSRQVLAEHFGIQKYSLQRCLNELQEAGAIRLDGKKIQILKLS